MRSVRVLAVGIWGVLLWQTVGEAAVFSHRHHVVKESLQCLDCHRAALTSNKASDNLLPNLAVCADCHDAEDLPELPVPPDRSIRFAHEQHISTHKLDCLECHTGVEQAEEPLPISVLPGMATCKKCHEDEPGYFLPAPTEPRSGAALNGGPATWQGGMDAAPQECETCHRNTRSQLKPESHQDAWVNNHGPEARLGEGTCFSCHRTNECQECHEGAQLSEWVDSQHQIPFASRMEGTKGQAVLSVHGQNFRFLHGLEARGKRRECATCHELEAGEFCAPCHRSVGDQGIRPVWHGGADWVPLNGGGRHARMARQDLENCISCHDLDGGDPTCQRCHRPGEEEEEEEGE